ncbi:oligopeptide/dipeptide ABC transporter ATPase [Gracilibacillus halophilus YIM-C55.5]|uniref:Nickel import system ATP-binding protein NikD n=1 Tax=Gracilibacillus halophilus YIM-C55.5 TaxID=1308866 RepID=N4W8N1_9BACI|nr:ABC transporter ATP-binding protein [Gracilibacillus halophilus]ENH96638.1 oligopeptide/dipeptide ABC transporter ATPase [Gracilibacillus halophilus YIM-C55.5]
MKPILTIDQLSIVHRVSEQRLLNQVTLSLQPGEVLGLVGASGSGKSLLAQGIFHLLPTNLYRTGEIYYNKRPITTHDRGTNLVYIPQSVEALDPLMKVGKQIVEVIREMNPEQKMLELLQRLGLQKEMASKYPFQLSGGEARRVLVAIAFATQAEVVIADEPTPGLDEATKREVITLFQELQQSGKTILFITHDFDVGLQLADRIAVMNQGEIVEVADQTSFSGDGDQLQHPYTKKLWQALPQNDFTGSS